MNAIPPIQLAVVQVTPFQQNCSIIWDNYTKDAVIVDPGGDVENILKVLKDNSVNPKEIWITHGHLDHAGGAMELARTLGIKIIGPHIDDKFWLDQIVSSWARYGYNIGEDCTPDVWLNDGDKVSVGQFEFDVVHCPGHTPGHVAFINKELGLAFVGDLLFAGSIGRTDFPKGNHADLLKSITTKLWPYGNEIQFVPGHGPMSTFGNERANNPFVSDEVMKRQA
ncbi:MBL fold metallo-hydrolase [Pseudaquidulcibacter saccharophilus]|uniref:MBL fold metallo-hydrolase n=1 Tax=Pseudaquidulcibacter saccharophilus TaxID=2831900 RepID=UPI001EFF3FE6|nr:MBL fold metallo-hydrolase [Pseudaquidulcibacter saccharophilus]